ncbi:MAG: trimeric intracellular cation channel family protein [Crocinitomicaceae bacterium]|nr:trimeric intracellular cation channel family protein [Crocinitomicaceae bacterium]
MNVIYILDIVGVAVFSISGFLAARENKMDLFGGIIIAFVTSIGGGTIRDLLLDTRVGWMSNEVYVLVALSSAVFAYFFAKQLHYLRRTLKFYDAVGLGLYAILGLEKALEHGENYSVGIILGVVSASFGGVLRDVLCNKIPFLFQREIYGTAAVIGCGFYVLMDYVGWANDFTFVLACLLITTIRLIAVRFNYKLPFLNESI